ncbi:MAG: FKBP-type peptidyl-prolyl cis-trans isomerase [Ktedonobacteraceae bacterium]
MPQTENGQSIPEATPRPIRPGQRQQERMQRIARRQKRRRVAASSIAAFLVVVVGIAGTLWFQNYNDQRIATINAHATATTDTANVHATGTAGFIANATATVVTKDCFISPNAPAIPAIYTASTPPAAGPTTSPAISGTPVALSGGLQYVDMKAGTGAVVKSGNTISVNYTGWLASTCQKFDSAFDGHQDQTGQTQPGQPFSTAISKGNVIDGWVEGIVGMKVGGIRRLYIPAALAYGSAGSQKDQNGNQAIPPNAVLIFDVQVLSAS